jgi:cation diffusion facilitator family transporter
VVAVQPRPRVLTSRYAEVSRVLVRVLALNLLVAGAKIAVGLWSGAVSVLSDGFHSLTDSTSNVAALIGIHLAGRPPDDTHPYGHRKFETLASAAIFIFLLLLLVEVVRTALGRLGAPEPIAVSPLTVGVMVVTLFINLLVVRYESAAGRRLNSELLLADATHTRSDVLTSGTVLAALGGVAMGIPQLDALAALIIAGFIGYAAWGIARTTTDILADRVVMDEAQIRAVIMSVDGVVGCHQIRTRGTDDHIFLDLHLWLPADLPLVTAHLRSHIVKDRLMAQFPAVRDVVIHIEPPDDQRAEPPSA